MPHPKVVNAFKAIMLVAQVVQDQSCVWGDTNGSSKLSSKGRSLEHLGGEVGMRHGHKFNLKTYLDDVTLPS
jgi:hypothetical protein